jgi:hypothetical protein
MTKSGKEREGSPVFSVSEETVDRLFAAFQETPVTVPAPL